MCGGGVTFGNGVTSIQFVSHIAHNREVPPWTVGVIKARGTEVFYALGMGDSHAAANLTPSSFRLHEA